MRWLEEEVTRITGKNDQMMKENLLLRHVLEEQAGKINELVRRNEKREAALKTSSSDVKSEPVVEVAPVAPAPVVAPKSVQAAPAKKAATKKAPKAAAAAKKAPTKKAIKQAAKAYRAAPVASAKKAKK